MPPLPAFVLARPPLTDEDALRRNLEDCLKEYSELDLLIELLQNALDAIDLERFQLICGLLGRDPGNVDTVRAWNQAVGTCLDRDLSAYRAADSLSGRATLYKTWQDQQARRDAWWTTVADAFAFDRAKLIPAVGGMVYTPALKLTLDRRVAGSV